MRHAFTAKEITTLLGVGPDEARRLIAVAFPQPRDVFNAHDLEVLQSVKQRQHAEATQRVFDFAGATAIGPTTPRGSTMRQNAEQLYVAAMELEEHDPAQAVDAYIEAVAANPMHADAHVNLGRMLHERGRLREAEAHYVAALVCGPANATALFNLAVVLEDLGDADAAIKRYQEALAIDPLCVDAYFNLGRLYANKGEKMAAIRHLKDYRRLTQHR